MSSWEFLSVWVFRSLLESSQPLCKFCILSVFPVYWLTSAIA